MLSIIAYILIGIGGIGLLVGYLWYLMVAFQKGILWVVGSIIIPFVSLFFLIKFWHDAWKPFVLQLVSIVVLVAGLFVYAMGVDTTSLADTMADDDSYVASDDYGEEYGDDAYDGQDDGDDAYGDDTYDSADEDADPYAEDDGEATAANGEASETLADDADAEGLGSAGSGSSAPPLQAATLPEASLGAASNAPKTSRSTTPPARLGGGFSRSGDEGSIPIDFAVDYIGQRLKITKSGGNVVYCRLVDVTDDALVVHQTLGGGHVQFTLPKDSIARISKDAR